VCQTKHDARHTFEIAIGCPQNMLGAPKYYIFMTIICTWRNKK
jgi:hypothetical protein